MIQAVVAAAMFLLLSALTVSLFWILQVRFGNTEDLDPNDFFVKHFSRSRPAAKSESVDVPRTSPLPEVTPLVARYYKPIHFGWQCAIFSAEQGELTKSEISPHRPIPDERPLELILFEKSGKSGGKSGYLSYAYAAGSQAPHRRLMRTVPFSDWAREELELSSKPS